MANWYSYNGVGDPASPASYRLTTVKPSCIGTGCKICAIYLNQSSSVPSAIDANVLNYIADAQVTQVSQPPGGAKRFVYLKTC